MTERRPKGALDAEASETTLPRPEGRGTVVGLLGRGLTPDEVLTEHPTLTHDGSWPP